MPRTFGVEEELLLVRTDGRPTPAADRVVEGADELDHEFKKEQTEIGTEPCVDVDQLTRQLVALRSKADDSARRSGARVAALATSPLKVRPTVTDDDRYRRMSERFGMLAGQQLTCGQHVHVQVSSRAEGVGALDRIGRWLPLILALSANSPYWQGRDTGHASYRSILWSLWPTAGPTAPFGDPAGYDRSVTGLIGSGAAIDDGMIYFDARLSATYPTLEIRVADVCLDVADAVLIAALCRALVDTAADQWHRGEPPTAARPELQRAAQWRAARYGLTGDLIDPLGDRPIPAAAALDLLVEHLRDALADNGDLEPVRSGIARLIAGGTGSDRQRRVFGSANSLPAVVDDAVTRTTIAAPSTA